MMAEGAEPARLLLVGCGKMGGAMLTGWLKTGMVAQALVVEPNRDARTAVGDDPRVFWHDAADSLPRDVAVDAVILAVKPQQMDAVAPTYAAQAAAGAAMISIAAGKAVRAFEGYFGPSAAIVRAMPNTPGSIGCGMTVCVANAQVTEAQRALADRLMAAIGRVAWLDDEALMDAVTAVSGSGPAYVFHLIETLAAAGAEAGLPADLAATLALETVYGAGRLAQASEEAPAQLRVNVTSPGGTTAAALGVLMGQDGLQALMTRAVKAAADRSRELAG